MASDSLSRLLAVMVRLRAPDGCEWDRAQTPSSLAPYVVEEAYEVCEAIERGDAAGLREELGDLLFQVVFLARIAEEGGHFDFDAVAGGITDKLVRRHPHVFAASADGSPPEKGAWEAHKEQERRVRAEAAGEPTPGLLAGVARALPALVRAVKLQDRAARVGFDWPEVERVMEKVEEELAELRDEFAVAAPDRLDHELGDVLLAVSNVARHLGVDPEMALHRANRRFEQRFARMELLSAAAGRSMAGTTLDELEALWVRAKEDLARGGRG